MPKIIEVLGYAPFGAPPTAFPARLKAARTNAGLTRRQFAAKTGVHPGTVAKWERGEARPVLKPRRRLQIQLGIPPSETT